MSLRWRLKRETLVKLFTWNGILVATMLIVVANTALADDGIAVKEVAPTGKLRLGVVFAPAKTVFFVIKDASEKPQGVTADLGAALAQKNRGTHRISLVAQFW